MGLYVTNLLNYWNSFGKSLNVLVTSTTSMLLLFFFFLVVVVFAVVVDDRKWYFNLSIGWVAADAKQSIETETETEIETKTDTVNDTFMMSSQLTWTTASSTSPFFYIIVHIILYSSSLATAENDTRIDMAAIASSLYYYFIYLYCFFYIWFFGCFFSIYIRKSDRASNLWPVISQSGVWDKHATAETRWRCPPFGLGIAAACLAEQKPSGSRLTSDTWGPVFRHSERIQARWYDYDLVLFSLLARVRCVPLVSIIISVGVWQRRRTRMTELTFFENFFFFSCS